MLRLRGPAAGEEIQLECLGGSGCADPPRSDHPRGLRRSLRSVRLLGYPDSGGGGGAWGNALEIEWSPEKQTEETQGANEELGNGWGWEGQNQGSPRDTARTATARGAKGRRTACRELLQPGLSLGAKPHPASQSLPVSSLWVASAICGLVRFSSNKAQFYFPY